MRTDLRRLLVATVLALVVAAPLAAQPDGWTRPFPGHRVIGNLYAVGTYDLAVFLVTSDEGHFLINTGLEDSTEMIRGNIESLGFRLEDVRVLLQMQAHWDHTAALAEIKEMTGAEMWATAGDAPVLEDGGFSDPHFGGRESFPPVEVDRIIADGEVLELGDARLTVMESPGHTAGSSSYLMTVEENGREYSVAIANMGTINPGKRLVVDPTYPGRGRRLRRDVPASRRRSTSMSGSRRTGGSTACTTSSKGGRPTTPTRSSTPTVSWPRSSAWRTCTWSSSKPSADESRRVWRMGPTAAPSMAPGIRRRRSGAPPVGGGRAGQSAGAAGGSWGRHCRDSSAAIGTASDTAVADGTRRPVSTISRLAHGRVISVGVFAFAQGWIDWGSRC